MEWCAFASAAESNGGRWLTDCDEARREDQHNEGEDRCASRSEWVRATVGPVGGDDAHDVILRVEDVLLHIGDRLHNWRGHSVKNRVEEFMGLCFSGLCTSPFLRGARSAMDLLSLEGLGEQFGGLPNEGGWLDQPHGYVQAVSVIRAARNAVQARNLKALREKPGDGS